MKAGEIWRTPLARALRVSAMSCAVVALAGCSVFNPHVRVKEKACTDATFAGGMSCAVSYANDWRTIYYKSVGNDSILRTSVGLSLIPLSAVALYKGVTTTNRSHNIAALGIGAASLYTAGSFLQSSPRQKVYLAGSQAVGCAVLQMRPLLMLENDYQQLLTDLSALQTNMTGTTTKLRLAEVLLAQAKSEGAPAERLNDAEVETRLARALLDEAAKVRTDGRALAKAVQGSGITLRQAVDSIRDTVSSRISDTEPDLASIMAAVGNLGNVAQNFKPAIPTGLSTLPATPAPGVTIKGNAPKTASEDPLKTAVADVHKAAGDLAAAMNAVSGRLDDASGASVEAGLKGCTVAEVDTGFSVSPGGAQQSMEPGSTLRFDVTSASGAPRATLTGTELKELSVRIDVQNGAYVVVVTSTANTAGTAQLVIRDGTGKQSKVITLTVQKAGAAATTTTPTTTTTGAREQMTLSADQIKTIQKALNIDGASKRANGKDIEVIGVLGPQTTAALKDYQKAHNKTPVDGVVTAALFLELKKIADEHPDPVPAPAPGTPAPVVPAPTAPPSAAPAPAPATPTTPPNGSTSPANTPSVSTPPVASAECPAAPANAFEQTLKKQDIQHIQEALGLPESARTGVFDARTRSAIRDSPLPSVTRPAAKCQLNQSLANAILGV